MSVTFSPSVLPATGFAFTCGHPNGVTAHNFGTCAEARQLLADELEARGGTGHLAVCGDEYCQSTRMMVHTLTSAELPDLRVNASTAALLLRAMGLSVTVGDQPMGSVEAEEAQGRIAQAQASGTARLDSYVAHYLPRLAGIASAAREHGLEFQWA